MPRVRAMYDTSSGEEDLNINQKLIETIVSEDSKSKLPAVGAEEIQVRVSSITDTGDLFVMKVRKAKSSHFFSSKGIQLGIKFNDFRN